MSVIKQTVVLPFTTYLDFIPNTPYPRANSTISQTMTTTTFANVMDYGAKGDGTSNDDTAIANAFKSGKTGILFPSGHTFVVSKVLNLTLSKSITVYAYGATIKKSDKSNYGWLNLQGNKSISVVWAGGTIDGNQQNQIWFGNPHGGIYNAALGGHNRLLGGIGLDLFFVKDVALQNIVMDGICGESNTLTVIANCTSTNGALFHYNTESGSNGQSNAGAGDQGTAFKGRFTGANQACYVLDCVANGGGIGYQSSFPQSQKVGEVIPTNTVSLLCNSTFKNMAQDNIHFEDSYANLLFNVTTDCDSDGKFYQPRIWVSNSTGIFHANNCNFNNTVIHLRNKASMKLCMIAGGVISSTISYAHKAINDNSMDVIAGTTIRGVEVEALNLSSCLCQNTTIDNSRVIDSSSFTNCTIQGNPVINNSVGVTNSQTAADKSIFQSTITLNSTSGNLLGTLGTTSTTVDNGDGNGTGDGGGGGTLPSDFTLQGGVMLSWDSSTGADNYDIKRAAAGTDTFTTVASNIVGTTYTDNSIAVGTSYRFKVTAKNSTGTTDSDEIIIGDLTSDTSGGGGDGGGGDGGGTGGDGGGGGGTSTVTVGLLPWAHAEAIGLPLGRNRVVVSNGNGISVMQKYKGNIKFSPSVVWLAKTFPTDLVSYQRNLQVLANAVTSTIMPNFSLENEPNYNEVNGSLSTYISMTNIAVNMFSSKGIDVYSGGLTFPALAAIIAAKYNQEGDTQSWQIFRNHGFTAANDASINFMNGYLSYIAQNSVNIHFNFHVNIAADTLAVLPLVVAKLPQLAGAGKKIMCGECSFSNQNAADVTTALNILKGLDIVLLYSEENGGTLAVKFNTAMDNAVKAFVNAQ